MLSLRRTVEPTGLAVTLTQAEEQCRVAPGVDSDTLTLYIQAATAHAEKVMDRALLPQTLLISRSFFPGRRPVLGNSLGMYGVCSHVWDLCQYGMRPILLPRPPMVEVVSVTYLDPTGTRQTIDPDTLLVSSDAEPASISPKPGSWWPAIAWDRPDAIQVTYTAGSATVPPTVQLAILGLVAHWYENRESVVLTSSPNASTVVPQFVDELLLTAGAPTVFDYEE